MAIEMGLLESESNLSEAQGELKDRTVMVIGTAGTGKTWLARHLVGRLAEDGGRTALVSADMGQPSVGVPTCLALATSPPWNQAVAHWFIGDISPVGNLLPTVVGTARLAERARNEGAKSVVIDTGGLVEGGVGRALKYHKALASGVERVVAIQRDRELAPLINLLEQPSRSVLVCRSSPQAQDRSAQDRKAYRQRCYEKHFELAKPREFDAKCLVGLDWAPVTDDPRAYVMPSTVVGLLDQYGFCLALGIVDEMDHDRIVVDTPWSDPASVARVQLGKVQINRRGFGEAR